LVLFDTESQLCTRQLILLPVCNQRILNCILQIYISFYLFRFSKVVLLLPNMLVQLML